MADSAVYIELASASGDTFDNARLDDVNIFPKYATQNILLGTSNSDISTMVITSNGVGVRKTLPSYTFDVLGDAFLSGNVYTSFDVMPTFYSYPPPASTSSFTTSNVTISSQTYGNGLYTISSSTQIDAFQPAYRAFDNSLTTPWQSAQRYSIGGAYAGACNTSATGGCNYTGEWIDIALPVSLSLSNVRMAVSGSLGYAPNQFVFLGTSNSGSNWDTLMSASNYNAWVSSPTTSNQASSFAVTTSNFYNRYRLVVQRVSNLDLVTINYMSLDGTTSNTISPYVGVGTSNPTAKFHVTGKVLSDAQVLVTSNDSVNAPGYAYNGDSNTGFFHPSTGSVAFVSQGTERLRFAGTGRLGVGTSNPGCRICVADYDGTTEPTQYAIMQITQNSNGNAAGNSNQALLAFHRSNAYQVGMGFAKGSNIFGFGHAQLSNTDFSPSLLTINSNGNVGIGTTSAPVKLTLSGADSSISGPHINFLTAADIHPVVQMLPYAHNNAHIAMDAYFDGTNWKSSTNTGNFVITKGGAGFVLNCSSNIASNANITAWSNAFTLTSGGNIGVGTSSPAYKLDVAGDINFTGTLRSNGVAFTGTGGGNATHWSNNSSNVYINYRSNVGIGTTTPSTALHVWSGNVTMETGPSASNATATMFLNFVETGFNDRCGILTEFAGSGDQNRISITTSSLGSNPVSGDARLTVVQSGKVGIGTLAPSTTLDVNGTINATTYQGTTITNLSNMALFGSNTSVWASNNLVNKAGDTMTGSLTMTTTTPFFTMSNSSGNSTIGMAGTNGNFSSSSLAGDVVIRAGTTGKRVLLQSGTGQSAITINSNNTVGINTTNPVELFHVNGNIYGSNQIMASSTNDASNTPAFTWRENNNTGMYHHATDSIGLSTGGIPRVLINSSGLVGIGTTTPSNALQVIGGITACNSIIHTSNEIGLSPNAYNPLLIWDDQQATTTFTGITFGTATRDTSNNYIQLTSNNSNQLGFASWQMNPGNAFHLSFDYFSGGTGSGTGSGDGLWVGWHMLTSNVMYDNNGYKIVFDEYNGSAGNDRVYTQYYGTTIDTWDLGQTAYLDNSTWKRIDIQYIRGTISISIDNGTRTRVFADSNERSNMWNTNTWLNFAAYCGGAYNAHRIRNLRLSKIDQGLWSLTTMSNTADVVYPYGNVLVAKSVGIGTTAPTAKLHITPNNSSNPDLNGLYVYNSNASGHSIATLRTSNTTGGNPWLSLDINGVGGWGIGVDNADSQKLKITSTWDFVTASSTRLTINRANGNVGIGTASPSFLLDVNGEVASRSANAFRMRQSMYSTFWRNDNSNTWLLVTACNDVDGNWNSLRPFQFTHSSGVVRLADTMNMSNAGNVVLDSGRDFIVTSGANWTGKFQLFSGETGGSNAAQLFYITRGASNVGWQNHLAIHCDNFNGAGVNFVTPGAVSRMFLNGSNGNFGIGTTSPSYLLDVNGNARIGKTYIHISGNDMIIMNSNLTANINGSFALYQGSTGETVINAATGQQVCMKINNAEHFRLTSNGNVGIGTTSPSEKFHVNGKIYGSNQILTSTANDQSNVPGFSWREDSNTGMYHLTTSTIGFSTAGAPRMVINSSGDVGIGTTSPSYRADVRGTGMQLLGGSGNTPTVFYLNTTGVGSTSGEIQFVNSGHFIACTDSNPYKGTYSLVGSGHNIVYSSGGHNFYNGNIRVYTNNLYVDGNVGVGTTSPAYKLDVNGGIQGANCRIAVQGSVDGTSARGIYMWDLTDTNWGIYVATSNASKSLANGNTCGFGTVTSYAIRFRTFISANNGFIFENSSEQALVGIRSSDGQMYIAGNLGVGTTSPSQKLHVVGNIFATGDIVAFSDKRLKSNINLIDNALARVHKLNGYIFNVKGDTTNRKHTGLIAQEVKEVLPEAIYKNSEDDMYSIAYGNMSGLLVQAIKEIDTKYKKQFVSMKNKIKMLQKEIKTLKKKCATVSSCL